MRALAHLTLRVLLLAAALLVGCSSNEVKAPEPCTPDCAGRVCGSDGCGGSCGACPGGQTCTVQGACTTACVPDCTGLICGDDGCGGSCGDCEAGFFCQQGECLACTCEGRNCGDDGCGNSCGTCTATVGEICNDAFQCVICNGDCVGRECGDDGCGRNCGDCQAAQFCDEAGQCQDCSCEGRNCGDDGCGNSCGECTLPDVCNERGQCAPCVRDCTGRECGDDGCGGSCGNCPRNSSRLTGCSDFGLCLCFIPCPLDCGDKACGPNECGGSCGECGEGEVCAFRAGRNPGWDCEDYAGLSTNFSFFLATAAPLGGGNFGGLAGADAICQAAAESVGGGGRTWRAYLSTSDPEVNARDRIGTGPWFNAKGERIPVGACGGAGEPSCLDQLHTENMPVERILTEFALQSPWSYSHDIYTGSTPTGLASGSDCSGWTSASEQDAGTVGHSDGTRPGFDESWNSRHDTGCDFVSLACTAGRPQFYCFATN